MKILIADDDFVSRRLLKAILEKQGDCDVASSGDEAVFAFKMAIKERKPYQVIFLDIMMPGSDGYSALREIRNVEHKRKDHLKGGVKIIMATSVDEPEMVMKAFKDQCDGYLVKPITPDGVNEALVKAGFSLKAAKKPIQ